MQTATMTPVEALRDIELRMTQARIASEIGRKSGRAEADFLRRELEQVGKIARAAIERGEQPNRVAVVVAGGCCVQVAADRPDGVVAVLVDEDNIKDDPEAEPDPSIRDLLDDPAKTIL